ncbi:MAG: serine--tRNA ligase [Candidatus Micrarchaeota archaeon]|nr:serine--tRNA ligase [Candidatus Micrarchaeota archaeon]
MLSLKLIRENPSILEDALKSRQAPMEPVEKLMALDKKWRALKLEADKLKAERNAESMKIAEAKKKGNDAAPILELTRKLAGKITQVDADADGLESQMNAILLNVPNLPDKTVPQGKSEADNPEVRKWGEPKKGSKDSKPHYEMAEKRLIDFERGSKLSGHRFVFLKGLAARLELALIHYMMSLHSANGYTEIIPPYLVSSKTMTGTGQLPKFAEELYKIENEDLWLIPTAEVPVTNLFAGEIMEEASLPMRFAAYSMCFRREAGSYQKDIKGIMRQHQFNKVELVHFSLPENSSDELQRITKEAELVLQKLEMPYRVIELCTADLGFASAKTYDIEVWLPSQDKYREISSCSNCTDFQARRANIRFRRDNKMEFVHTLNGSGIAIGRTMIAIMENYQDEDGFAVPKVLRDYMRCDRVDF